MLGTVSQRTTGRRAWATPPAEILAARSAGGAQESAADESPGCGSTQRRCAYCLLRRSQLSFWCSAWRREDGRKETALRCKVPIGRALMATLRLGAGLVRSFGRDRGSQHSNGSSSVRAASSPFYADTLPPTGGFNLVCGAHFECFFLLMVFKRPKFGLFFKKIRQGLGACGGLSLGTSRCFLGFLPPSPRGSFVRRP
jgi:hypothetical protein